MASVCIATLPRHPSSKFFLNKLQQMAIARRQIGMIKRALYLAQERARLIAYRPLCPQIYNMVPVLQTFLQKRSRHLKWCKIQGVKMICSLKTRRYECQRKISTGGVELSAQKLSRHTLSLILSKQEAHPALCSSCDDMDQPPTPVDRDKIPVPKRAALYFNAGSCF